MPKVFIIQKRHLAITAAATAVLIATALYWNYHSNVAAGGDLSGERPIHMVTGEFKATTSEGKEIEAYIWHPGTINVRKGEQVTLNIYGVNGASHPFIIEGMNIKGEVKKGKETLVTFTPTKEGIYRLICLTHPDSANDGPMIAYIVVN